MAIILRPIVAALLLFPSAAMAIAADETRPAETANTKAVSELKTALEKIPELPTSAERRAAYLQAATDLTAAVPNNVLVKSLLEKATASASKQPGDENADNDAAKILRAALYEAQGLLTFKPLMEAKLPEGFPPVTTVGEIQIKQYPAYRLARAALKENQNRAFMTLFNHISENEIAMTAPVEMTYKAEKDGVPQETAMAFLYGKPTIGELGTAGKVEVVDVPAMTTVSIGMRGEFTDARVAELQAALEKWLHSQAAYEVDGNLRVLGYNSPFVPRAMRYFEVELPVKKAE